MSTEHDLVDLLERREQTYQEFTRAILWAMLPALKGIVRFFDVTDRAANGFLEWQDVTVMRGDELANNPGEDVLFVSGFISYDIGEIYETSTGERIEVTEENKEFMNKFIKIGIPVSIALTADEDAVVEFLTESEIRKNEREIEMQRMAEEYASEEWEVVDEHEHEYGEEIAEVDFSELIAKINANVLANNPEPVVEFDVDKLTPDQKASYLMYLKTSSKQ